MVLVLKQILRPELDSVTVEKFDVFLLKRPSSVMYLLVPDVLFNDRNLRVTDCESAITFLPFECLGCLRLFMHPFRRVGFDVADDFGNGDAC